MNAPAIMSRSGKLFKSNRSQAVRIPKDLAFPDAIKDVIIRREGNQLIISPADTFWDDFFAGGPNPEFPERDQPPMQERDWGFDD